MQTKGRREMDKVEGEKGGGDDRDRLEDSERQIEMEGSSKLSVLLSVRSFADTQMNGRRFEGDGMEAIKESHRGRRTLTHTYTYLRFSCANSREKHFCAHQTTFSVYRQACKPS